MTKQLSVFFSGSLRATLLVSFGILSFSACSEESLDQAALVPSCVNLCYEEKSGKARRGCASICQAEENSCMETGGQFQFQADEQQYLCTSSENIGIAKQ